MYVTSTKSCRRYVWDRGCLRGRGSKGQSHDGVHNATGDGELPYMPVLGLIGDKAKVKARTRSQWTVGSSWKASLLGKEAEGTRV